MLAVILLGLLTKRVSALAAKIALIAGPVTFYLLVFMFESQVQTFLKGIFGVEDDIHFLHLLAFVFIITVIAMLAVSYFKPSDKVYSAKSSGVVDLTPWRHANKVGLLITILTISFYVLLAQ
jgi:SSS family solute:Na+ symporter